MTAVKNIPALIGGAAVLAAAAIGLTAAIASAEWDIEAYDNCMRKTIREPTECCVSSGGYVGPGGQGCVAPPALAQVTEPPDAPPPFTIGTLAPVATDAPVGPAPGNGSTFHTPSGGVAAP
jgi:hypothetical protein